MVDCLFMYEGDYMFGGDQVMYDLLTEEGHDARMYRFSGGGHNSPPSYIDWGVGCLGIVAPCTTSCEASFVTCVSGGSFTQCLRDLSTLAGCSAGCAPTLTMMSTTATPSSSSYTAGVAFGAAASSAVTTRPASSVCLLDTYDDLVEAAADPAPTDEVVLYLATVAGDLQDLDDAERATIRSAIASAAGVGLMYVSVTFVSASINIYAIISIPPGTSASTISSSVSTNLGSTAAASAALGQPVEATTVSTTTYAAASNAATNNAINSFLNDVAALATGALVAVIVAPTVCCIICCSLIALYLRAHNNRKPKKTTTGSV